MFILLSKGCVELQNPPQFTLEEVVVLDFSEKEVVARSSSPQQPQPVVQEPAPKEVTQEESPVETPTSSNTQQTTSQETTSEPDQNQNNQKMTLVIYLVMDQEIIKEEMAKVKVRELELEMGLILAEEWVMEKADKLLEIQS